MTSQDRSVKAEIERVIAKWRKEEADYKRLASEHAAYGGSLYVRYLAKHELAKRYADELESLLSALIAEAPQRLECPKCTRPVRNGDIACPWCKHHLGKEVAPVLAEASSQPTEEQGDTRVAHRRWHDGNAQAWEDLRADGGLPEAPRSAPATAAPPKPLWVKGAERLKKCFDERLWGHALFCNYSTTTGAFCNCGAAQILAALKEYSATAEEQK